MPSQVRIVDLPGGEKDTGGSGKEKTRTKPKPPPVSDRDLKTRLIACFERIAAAAEARDDEELAEVIREDAEVMANGLVGLTRPFRVLRTPVTILLGIVEPVMAFQRIVRLMLERMIDRRAERRATMQPESPHA